MHCTLLDETITPYVLPATPTVLSTGKLCMEHGFSFYWDAGKAPVLATPNGQVLPLSVVKNIPFLNIRDPKVGLCDP